MDSLEDNHHNTNVPHSKNLVRNSESIDHAKFLADLGSKPCDEELMRLSREMKATCDDHGVEKCPSKSAEIIHKLGLLYFQGYSDKISLLKSIGLLNSAIARKPNNVSDIERDLSKICLHILNQANARDQTTNLIAKSNSFKSQIISMRIETDQKLKALENPQNKVIKNLSLENEKIKSITKLQLQICEQFKDIMKNICCYSAEVMGPPPCKFAVVGLGSLARKEVTPYSDFEHIIVLEGSPDYPNYLEYFRWFSVIFHTMILNLQETNIPTLHVKFLNTSSSELGNWFFDNHTSGVSIDGMMPHACKFPLGRTQPTKEKPWITELIKPVDEMMKYLKFEESLKNGYYLSEILMDTCYVYGEQTLHEEFANKIQLYKKSKTFNETAQHIRPRVEEDLQKYAISLANFKPDKNLNIKKMLFRACTLFITAMGRLYGAQSSSSFDILNELAEKRKISNYAKHKLSYAVAIACEVRLKVYLKEDSQRDYVRPRDNSETSFDEMLKIVDKEAIIRYLQATYCLQHEVSILLGIQANHGQSNRKLLNVMICHVLKLDDLMLALLAKHNENHTSRPQDETMNLSKKNKITPKQQNHSFQVDRANYFDKCLAEVEKDFQNFCDFKSNLPSHTQVKIILINLLRLMSTSSEINIGDLVEFSKRAMNILKLASPSKQHTQLDYNNHFHASTAQLWIKHIDELLSKG